MNSDPSLRRRQDLEEHIGETLQLIKQYEDIKRLSDDPKEKLRCDREIADLKVGLERYKRELTLINSVGSEKTIDAASDEYISDKNIYTVRDANEVEVSINDIPEISYQVVDEQYEKDLLYKIGEHLIQELHTPNQEPQKIVYDWLATNLQDFTNANNYIYDLMENMVKGIVGDVENSLEAANEFEKLLRLSTAMLQIFQSLSNEIVFPEERLTPNNQLSRVSELTSSTVEQMNSLADGNSWGREVSKIIMQIEKNLELLTRLNSEVIAWITSMIARAQEYHE